MNKRDIDKLKIGGELFCCPKEYQGLPDVSDDYDVSAMIVGIKKKLVHDKVMEAIVCEEDFKYGPSSGYKGRYSYNRDD